jgi:hypothetical protein
MKADGSRFLGASRTRKEEVRFRLKPGIRTSGRYLVTICFRGGRRPLRRLRLRGDSDPPSGQGLREALEDRRTIVPGSVCNHHRGIHRAYSPSRLRPARRVYGTRRASKRREAEGERPKTRLRVAGSGIFDESRKHHSLLGGDVSNAGRPEHRTVFSPLDSSV